jgi:hypothetical protein
MALVCCTLGKFLGVVCHCFLPRLDVPTFAATCLHVHNDARDPSSERQNYGWEILSGNFAYMASLFTPLGIFYMPQIYDMGPTALLPLWRKACRGFFLPLKIWRLQPGLNPWTWVLKASMLPLDHRSCSWCLCFNGNSFTHFSSVNGQCIQGNQQTLVWQTASTPTSWCYATWC